MLPSHEAAFTTTARKLNVVILVRRTNQQSLRHIGQGYAVPKRIDCKAKTADFGFMTPDVGYRDVAGLVVDPTVTGRGAFRPDRFQLAENEWRNFKDAMIPSDIYNIEALQRYTYLPRGGIYFVELRPYERFFGCVKYTTGLISAGRVIHADYDLYGIVPMDNPSQNIRVTENVGRYDHARDPYFRDVQMNLNRAFGVPMVLHGAQEAYAAQHTNETVDVFFPDGLTYVINSRSELERLYAGEFRGRRLFSEFRRTYRYHSNS